MLMCEKSVRFLAIGMAFFLSASMSDALAVWSIGNGTTSYMAGATVSCGGGKGLGSATIQQQYTTNNTTWTAFGGAENCLDSGTPPVYWMNPDRNGNGKLIAVIINPNALKYRVHLDPNGGAGKFSSQYTVVP